MKLVCMFVMMVLTWVAVAAMPAEETDVPTDLVADDLQGSEFFFKPRYYRPRYYYRSYYRPYYSGYSGYGRRRYW